MPPTKPPPPRRNRPASTDPVVKSESASSSPAPSRLPSLGARSVPGGGSVPGSPAPAASSSGPKRSFLPKQVQRRSKEERDKSAPTASKVTVVPTPESVRGRGSGRGDRGGARGRGRGGRGRGRFEPVATQAVGAFSSIGAYDGRRRVGPAFEIKGTASVGQEMSGILKGGDDDEEDGNAFNMTRSLGVDIDDFFPVRPVREEEKVADDSALKVEDEDDFSDHLEEVEVEVEDPDAPRIKSEPGSRAVSATLSTKTVTVTRQVRSKSTTPFVLPAAKQNTYVSPEEMVELKRVARDHKTIAQEFNINQKRQSVSPSVEPEQAVGESTETPPEIEQKLFFFQMPVLRPKFAPASGEEPAEPEPASKPAAATAAADDATEPSALSQYPPGLAGKLRVHASGKLTMLLGNVVMEVSQGAEASFLQDIVAMDPADQKAYLIGQVTRKMIVAPDVDLLIKGVANMSTQDKPIEV